MIAFIFHAEETEFLYWRVGVVKDKMLRSRLRLRGWPWIWLGLWLFVYLLLTVGVKEAQQEVNTCAEKYP